MIFVKCYSCCISFISYKSLELYKPYCSKGLQRNMTRKRDNTTRKWDDIARKRDDMTRKWDNTTSKY